MPQPAPNALYYGDNLDVMRRHVDDESVDLAYLDPPFNSAASYNVLFSTKGGGAAAAQVRAFEDTWHWDEAAAAAFRAIVDAGGHFAELFVGFRAVVSEADMLAYLVMMCPRLAELHRVLKPTGSLYLHCDPTASHYLKLLLDAVFGPHRFRSEVAWRRSGAHSDAKQGRRNYGHIHDVLLFYTKGEAYTWNTQYTPYDEAYVARDYRLVDEDGRRFRRDNLTAAKPGGDVSYEWRVKRPAGLRVRWQADLEDEHLAPLEGWEYKGVPPYAGRFWAYSLENMRQFARENRIRHTFDGMPEFKRFLDEMPGVPLQDLWTDIEALHSQSAERLGYPTQKPEALLERIIAVSSNPGDVVLDPFCGCGTAVVAAQKLGRRWVGVDLTYLAVSLMKKRLTDTYGEAARFRVVGEPTTLEDAVALAASDPYQFQWWALGLCGARPADEKKGADKGVDGRLFFHDGPAGGVPKQIVFSVKAGNVSAAHVRDLGHVVHRDKAAIGVLISMQDPTKPMRSEAAGAGFYESAHWGRFPRLQLLTVAELLGGKGVQMPAPRQTNATLRQAPRARERDEQRSFL
ncbi:restriction endonuclease subunit M [Gemmatimonadetes bacterium T265]|nr:restriction endonuclease subunit M [Gemmatimonadetes bacterium T265]